MVPEVMKTLLPEVSLSEKRSRALFFLIVLALLTLGCRFYFAFSTPYYSDGESYRNIDQAINVRTNALPDYDDDRIFGSRHLVFFPFFHYIMALFSLLAPSAFAFKLASNILAVSGIFIVFFISHHITRNYFISCISAFMSAFVPVFFSSTALNVSVQSFALPLTFLCIYLFMRSENQDYLIVFICSVVVLALSSSTALILGLSLVIYLLFGVVAGFKPKKRDIELTLFSSLFILWSGFVVYKNAILFHGSDIVWQNIPPAILEQYFSQVTIIGAIYAIGVIPFIFGIYIIKRYSFSPENRRDLHLVIALSLSSAILLYLKLVPLVAGLMYLGIALVILTSQFLKILFVFISKSRFPLLRKYIASFFILIFLITSVPPSFHLASLEVGKAELLSDYDAFNWIRLNTDRDAMILVPPEQASVMSFVSGRRFVLDNYFIYVSNPEQRLNDIHDIYTSPYATNAVYLLDRYGIDYIVLSRFARQKYHITDLEYVSDLQDSCISLVYSGESLIFKSDCLIIEESESE